jgi:hypothetical protein
VYSTGPKRFRRESRFLTDDLRVSASSISASWNDFSTRDQLEFALAFSAKPVITGEDEKILDFLMKAGPPGVWSNIALLLCRHSDHDRVLDFLMTRVQAEQGVRANYFKAIELLNDSKAVPVLKRLYESYRNGAPLLKQDALNEAEFGRMFDYLYCCRALLILDGSEEFEAAIREILAGSNQRLRGTASRLLSLR